MINIQINDKPVQAKEGATILEVAREAGIDIPTVCYNEQLTPLGSCRVCTVEISFNGRPQVTTACNYPVRPGLKVWTNSEAAKEARRLAVELLMAQQPHSEVLQQLARKLGIEKPRFAAAPKECILCNLCTRACKELVGQEAITFVTRQNGTEAGVVHVPEKCIGCDSCAYVCPTKAITVEDVGDTRILHTPSGDLKFKLKKCKVCGRYWAPEEQLKRLAEKSNQPEDIFDVCITCRP